MPRILVVGHCPLPSEATDKTFGPGLRTWQFTKALHDAGHDVLLVAARIPSVYAEETGYGSESPQPRLTIVRVGEKTLERDRFLQRTHDEFDPDAIVAATIYPSFKAATLTTRVPLWLDFFGHVMAEAQAKAAVYGDPQYLAHFWRWVQCALDRGSVFSTVSHRQEYATIGELGTRGRLNALTAGYRFTWPIPCAVEEDGFDGGDADIPGVDVRDGAFVVVSTGGFNTWVDIATLYSGLELAMRRNPALVFVATGGSIPGHDDKTFPAFEAMVRRGPFSTRVFLLGWRNKREIPSILARAHLAINVDKDLIEARLGSRNRFLDWSRAALPFVTTRLCELSEDLADRGLCWSIPPGDPGALADAVVGAAADPLRRQRGQALRDYCRERYSIATTTQPLIRWAATPTMAPDQAARGTSALTIDRMWPPGSWAARVARIEARLRKSW